MNERIGKVFKLGVRDVDGCRIVDGYVRGKKLANIVRSIDNLECVTDKLRNVENAESAIQCYPERNLEQGQCWGLLIEESGDRTYFCYSFVPDACEHPVAEIKAEPPKAGTHKAKKEKKASPKKGRAVGSAPKVFYVGPKKKQSLPPEVAKRNRVQEGLRMFSIKTALFIESMRAVFKPELAGNFTYAY
ncbi:hypothetical protein [Fibrobacter sp. UWH4]|uniref:hypothetical protein n=1 Tax=Fibrobacter sp. UWH4 TaxID=1896210 RepID=UPI00091E8148|nr:hypothetical protein [Fibrobacter sp. UWH4]SHL05240.1 hypothetical protein SAMN05720762_10466 [Fibrobacter sp. UWH4]